MPKTFRTHQLTLDSIVGGGQTIGTLEDGRKAFVWGGLPGEVVSFVETKRKKSFVEGVVTDVHKASPERIEPREQDSYLSTSPWQIMSFDAEQRGKSDLIVQAFALHNFVLQETDVFSDERAFEYRNKVEFSWWGDVDDHSNETLDLAFFRRGTKGKLPVDGTALAAEPINQLAREIRDALTARKVSARQLKTLLIRSSTNGDCAWQLYVKDEDFDTIDDTLASTFTARGGEVIYSDPRSPASRITKRLARFGDPVLTDSLQGVEFAYATEGFFQINLPVYEQALTDMEQWVTNGTVIDMYSGVGTIGLTIGGPNTTLVELDEHAVREMRQNISKLGSSATAVHAPAEKALDYISSDDCLIVDPPRAGLHADVIARINDVQPPRIIYLSCNPVTQARDVELLLPHYSISHHRGYNFFPRTPHIEHLVVLDRATA